MFSGSIPALVTPFRVEPSGASVFDEDAFRAFVDWQIGQGSAALVPCGTTGEASTLDLDEHHRVIAACIDQAAGRVPVIAGCGSNDTRTAISHIEKAAKAGADAALVVAPYYNRPSQEGIVAHYTALAAVSDLPIVVYNVPSRTVTDILPETLARLADIETIVAVKDASGIIDRVTAHRLGCGADFCQLSGNDNQALAFMAAGGSGCISVTANVAPRLCADFQKACANNDLDLARDLNDRLYPLHCALFSDASPAPVKYALSRLRTGFPIASRLPIIECSDVAKAAVDRALAIAGLA
ncbi:4-hydroxy-tetrahydrodipicolinate synthase [Sphingorhabdus soli]|uniref:4-hydroxy-tetrahydrodipicolinate synthase n=1 Tax=Flavisphingopyxis soli TaxID=2601267 RepID=A0A5C6UAV9_9SPHN|nr:4-hydroxy-tetrahydrodipicolinate synthase [Sphingorhabdus soli]TXC68955.1 4-hydroxy-tetrahydrodipicolinate synthase [Sphingorhabdus soli]